MSNISLQEVVTVWGKSYEITVYQKSKSVWVAVGEYMEERLEVQGRTSSAAARSWQEATRYRGG